MQFKHPEILYALFALLIPILVHLFQLRRFTKVAFTNVAFLKKVNIQTRKSSQIKKWLTLLMRLLALACIIIAFAQPFSASKTALNQEKETVIYLDNSFSMQAKGTTGPLLSRATQQLFENIGDTKGVSWFTNNFTRKNTTSTDFTSEILKISTSNNQLTLQEVILKAGQLFSENENSDKRLLLLSDFQQEGQFPKINNKFQIDAVQFKPVTNQNVSLDSIYIASRNANTVDLVVKLSASGEIPPSIPLSLYNGSLLIAKTSATITEGNSTTATFTVENPESFKGSVSITDPNLGYDNSLFFSINPSEKIKVLSINQGDADYLQRIFDTESFDYVQQTERNVNYNLIPSQNLVVLNELNQIPPALTNALTAFVANGGSLCIIPSKNIEVSQYNSLFEKLRLGSIAESISQEKKITQIVFDNPLYQDVFEKRVVNFQYPKINEYYRLTTNATSALKFEDGKPFIVSAGKVYASVAAFNKENSNFKSSPLIVPTLYNMALQSLPLPKLYYETGRPNTFSVPVKLVQDEILTLKDSTSSYIPLQVTKANQVDITVDEEPGYAATFSVTKDETPVQHVSLNYPRNESNLVYKNIADWGGVTAHKSVSQLFESVREENSITQFWKWFIILALLFLLFEMLILKFYKR